MHSQASRGPAIDVEEPEHIDRWRVLKAIDPAKHLDGFSSLQR
jgi:hypothetical protein